jgi:SAM-dependent methyltransferase
MPAKRPGRDVREYKARRKKANVLREHRADTRGRGYPYFNTPWKTVKNELRIDIRPVLKKPNPVIMDLGCGTGQALHDLLEITKGKAKLVGVSIAHLERWKKKPQIEYRVVPFHKLAKKFPPNSVDFAYSFYGVYYEDLGVVVKNVWPVLKPGGLFVFNVEKINLLANRGILKRYFKIKKIISEHDLNIIVHAEKRAEPKYATRVRT